MPTLTITKNYQDGTALTESQLDDIKTSVETFLNTTKIDSDNIQTSGIATANIANGAVTAAKLATDSITGVKIADAAITKAKMDGTTTSAYAELGNLSLACSVGSSALTIALKDKSGSDATSTTPITIGFRSSTAATGTYNVRSVIAANSITVNSGATLGHSDGGTHYIYVYAMDVSGSVELAVSSYLFDEGTRQSSTAIDTASDSYSVLYSTTARSNVPIRVLGRLTSTQATAGAYASVPTQISLSPFKRDLLPSMRATSNNGQTMTRNTFTTVVYEDLDFDNVNGYNASTGIYTCREAGIYMVTASAAAASTAGNDIAKMTVEKDGSTYQVGPTSRVNDTNSNVHGHVSALVKCAVGTELKALFYFDDSTTDRALTTTSAENVLTICKVAEI